MEAIHGNASRLYDDLPPNLPLYGILAWPSEVQEIWPTIKTINWIGIHVAFYFTFPFSILGVILNTGSILALRSSKYRSLRITFYLQTLTIVDFIALFLRCGVEPIRGLSVNFNRLFLENFWLCFLYGLISNSVNLMSAWLVVLITAVRVVAVARPFAWHRRHSTGSSRLAVVLVVAVCLFSFLLTFLRCYFSLAFEPVSPFNFKQCDYYPKSYKQSRLIYASHMAMFTWIPAILTLTGNFIIYCLIRTRHRQFHNQIKYYRHRTNLSIPPVLSTHTGHSKDLEISPATCWPLAFLSLVCAVLMLPLGVCSCIILYLAIFSPDSFSSVPTYDVAWTKLRLILISMLDICNNLYLWRFSLHLPVFALFGNSEMRNTIFNNLQYWIKNIKKLWRRKNSEAIVLTNFKSINREQSLQQNSQI